MLKCLGCYKLTRNVSQVSPEAFKGYRQKEGNILITYTCERFPYDAALSGLLYPSKRILVAAECCPEDPLSRCVLCQQTTGLIHYGANIVTICKAHDKAWGDWLDEQPERRKYIRPRARAITRNWVEVFRDFIEDMRLWEE